MTSILPKFEEPLAYAVFAGAKAANRAVNALVEAGFDDDHIFVLARGEDEEAEWVKVEFRSGVRTGMQWGALLGVVVGMYINWEASVPATELARQLMVGASLGLPLGMMTGLVAGLGHWAHIAEFPKRGYGSRPILVGVDLTAERHEKAARGAFGGVGATGVEVIDKQEAEMRIQAIPPG
jgi:hypothetical protein